MNCCLNIIKIEFYKIKQYSIINIYKIFKNYKLELINLNNNKINIIFYTRIILLFSLFCSSSFNNS